MSDGSTVLKINFLKSEIETWYFCFVAASGLHGYQHVKPTHAIYCYHHLHLVLHLIRVGLSAVATAQRDPQCAVHVLNHGHVDVVCHVDVGQLGSHLLHGGVRLGKVLSAIEFTAM
jgi:hypothetical protein